MVFNRMERSPVHDFRRAHSRFFERRNGRGGILYVPEIKLTRVTPWIIWQCVQHRFRDKSQSAFRADHDVREDVEWRVEIEQGVEQVAIRVFHLVTLCDTCCQLRVTFYTPPQIK